MKKSYDFKKAKRGAVLPAGTGKTRITIRIDDDVLEWFRKRVNEAGGGSYQTMINRALREHMEREAEPLEETLRRVLREVLPGSPTGRRRKAAKKKAGRKAASK
jgi:hypothetical protein